jgi:FtsP/CotA-like multicopper oxidase with cupredoxin domain
VGLRHAGHGRERLLGPPHARGTRHALDGESYSGGPERPASSPAQPGRDYAPTVTPGGTTLPWKVVDGVKVYHLVAEEVDHEFAPGLRAECWGYNGRVHGPTIEAVEGDRVRIYVTNRLSAPTTVHWHGIFLPNGMDGVGGSPSAIGPGETFRYEWTFRQSARSCTTRTTTR